MSDVHEVLCEARNIQERRGFRWLNGTVEGGGACCPGCSIAQAVGKDGYEQVIGHPAALVLAEQFRPCSCEDSHEDVSHRVNCEQTDRGHDLELSEVLAAFDRAIAATAPAPDLQLTTPEATVHCPAAGRSHRGPEPKVEAVR